MPAVLLEVEGGVAVVTLNQPEKRNPMSAAIMEGFAESIAAVRADAEVRAVIVTGAPPAFCAGADLKEPSPIAAPDGDLVGARERMRAFYWKFLCLTEVEVPTIAAVNGAAVGGGLGLALCADIRIFAEDAKLAANFVKLGIHPGMATTYHLPAAIGRSAAAELFFSGRFFLGAEAQALVLGRAVSADKVLSEARAVAQEIAANPPGVVRMIKKALSVSRSREDALEYEMSAQILTTRLSHREGG